MPTHLLHLLQIGTLVTAVFSNILPANIDAVNNLEMDLFLFFCVCVFAGSGGLFVHSNTRNLTVVYLLEVVISKQTASMLIELL